jgi:hypothetical protein
MKTRIKNTLQLILFLAAAGAAIYYVMKQSPLESADPEWISKPDRSTSSGTRSYSSDKDDSNSGSDVSLTGEKGRYDEARIGREE